jgi:GDPmannose 4,6-dehydratase
MLELQLKSLRNDLYLNKKILSILFYMKKSALITGVSGQDGVYLTRLLLKKNYRVIGTIKTYSKKNLKNFNIHNKIILKKLNIEKKLQVKKIFNKYTFDEVYNLAARSSVSESFKNPIKTFKTNGLGVVNILEEIKERKKIKYYQASSSEMFGNSNKRKYELSKFDPQSPYGHSKLFGHYVTKIYREVYGLYAVSGILFNHESTLRPENFVTKKIIKNFIDILDGRKNFFELGNVQIKRDWGYSKEYVELIWKMLQLKSPQDFVIATGKTYSLKDFVDTCASYLKFKTKWIGKGLNMKLIDKKKNKLLIKINKKYIRSTEIKNSRADITKATRILNWKPKVDFKNLIKLLIKDEIRKRKRINYKIFKKV